MFEDRLRRGLEMEEAMEGLLTDLTQPELDASDIPQDTKKKISDTLSKIKNDTLKHKGIVVGLLEKIKSL